MKFFNFRFFVSKNLIPEIIKIFDFLDETLKLKTLNFCVELEILNVLIFETVKLKTFHAINVGNKIINKH